MCYDYGRHNQVSHKMHNFTKHNSVSFCVTGLQMISFPQMSRQSDLVWYPRLVAGKNIITELFVLFRNEDNNLFTDTKD